MARLLVVDDDHAFRLSTAALLRADGHEVDVAPDASAAVLALGAHAYDLVLLDLRMPGIDGIQLVETLRIRGESVPVLMISGYGTVESAVRGSTRYNGFNLVAGQATIAAFGSNRTPDVQPLRRGIHGVSNAALDTPWPKLVRAKSGLAAWVKREDDDIDALFDVLADRVRAPEEALPNTGLTPEWERLLSAPFIVSADYGTRCSTVLVVGRNGTVALHERTFDASGTRTERTDVSFPLENEHGLGARSR